MTSAISIRIVVPIAAHFAIEFVGLTVVVILLLPKTVDLASLLTRRFVENLASITVVQVGW